jgi:hypothetical protein
MMECPKKERIGRSIIECPDVGSRSVRIDLTCRTLHGFHDLFYLRKVNTIRFEFIADKLKRSVGDFPERSDTSEVITMMPQRPHLVRINAENREYKHTQTSQSIYIYIHDSPYFFNNTTMTDVSFFHKISSHGIYRDIHRILVVYQNIYHLDMRYTLGLASGNILSL